MVFSKEFKSTFGKMIAWLLVIAILTGLLLAFYPLMLEDRMKSLVETFVNELSPNLKMILGLEESIDLTDPGQYIAFIFQYIAVLISIFAFQIGAQALAKEEETGSIQYIYSNPINRSEIVSQKLFSNITTLFIFLCGLFGITFAFIKVIALKYSQIDNGENLVNLVIIFLGILATALVFMSIGYFISSFSRSSSHAEGAGILFVIVVVLIVIAGKVLGETFFEVVNKFSYEVFKPIRLISANFDFIGMGINLIIFILMLVLTFITYNSKEFKF